MTKFTEIYFDDAERLAIYLSARDDRQIVMVTEDSDGFPMPPKFKELPRMVNALKVGSYEIAYLEKRNTPDADLKYRNRNLHRVMMGERVRNARDSRGMTLETLSDLTGIKTRNLENIENGRFDATIDVLSNIGEALGCHLDFVSD